MGEKKQVGCIVQSQLFTKQEDGLVILLVIWDNRKSQRTLVQEKKYRTHGDDATFPNMALEVSK